MGTEINRSYSENGWESCWKVNKTDEILFSFKPGCRISDAILSLEKYIRFA